MKFLDFIFAARPLLHLPVWSVYLITLYHHRPIPDSFRIVDFVLLAGLSLLFAGAFFLNQIYDYDSDLKNNKLGFLQQNLISISQMRLAFWAVSGVGLLGGLFVSLEVLGFLALLFVLSYMYSAPPARLKDRPLWGFYANAVAIGFLVSVAAVPEALMSLKIVTSWYLPVYFTLTVGAIYIVTTIPDMEGDAAISKNTIAVKIGPKASLLIASVLLALAIPTGYIAGETLLAGLAAMATLLSLMAMASGAEKVILAAAKVPLLLLTILAGFHYPFYFVFVVALILVTRIYYKLRFGKIYPRLT